MKIFDIILYIMGAVLITWAYVDLFTIEPIKRFLKTKYNDYKIKTKKG